MSSENILIIDDEEEVRSLMSDVLADEGYATHLAANEAEAVAVLKKSALDLVFLDLWMGDDESAGIKILGKIRKTYPEIPVIIISGHGTIDVAVQVIQNGAADFIEKPFVIERLLLTTKQALELRSLQKENAALRNNNKLDMEVFSVGSSIFTLSIKSTVEKIAPSNGRVFIKSQVGIGADAVAFLIHKKSQRRDGPFVYLNCIADNEENFEAELFGGEKFYGFIEKANSGTLFLEEITRLSKDCQRKLLQFLHEGKYAAGSRMVYSDFRVMCSSNDDMEEFLASGKFSQELYIRLNIINLHIPPLKDRREDIIPLAEYYISNSWSFFGLKPKKISPDAVAILQSYDWPGNIHQLKNVMECSLINSAHKNEIDRDSLPPELISSPGDKFDSLNVAKLVSLPLRKAKECFESDYLRAQVIRFSGNISQTAWFVGMERSALHRKLKTLGIHPDRKAKANSLK
ncbi:MAG: sigma-54 dependent transcriptional regulator [Holosporaceae bacterium]|jgi:two-component system nitrogen regulation response regulator NtrX|nr:sigma-54 dependent transcriptional regulator [Holosporaceae bacterium]